jgi:hypothetical protein
MKHKIDELNKAIREKASELGLIFVSGPDPGPVDADGLQGVCPKYDTTNHQQRATYLFGVAGAF